MGSPKIMQNQFEKSNLDILNTAQNLRWEQESVLHKFCRTGKIVLSSRIFSQCLNYKHDKCDEL